MKVVLASYKQLSVGTRIADSVTDARRKRHDGLPIHVLREVDELDYHQSLRDHGANPDEEPPFFQPVWFYEVLMD